MQTRMILRLAIVACAAFSLAGAELDTKIQRVENGLQAPIAIKGQPIAKMSIAERLKFYHVPGISVVGLDGGRIEWARGYGVTSAEVGKPVNVAPLFQAASIR